MASWSCRLMMAGWLTSWICDGSYYTLIPVIWGHRACPFILGSLFISIINFTRIKSVVFKKMWEIQLHVTVLYTHASFCSILLKWLCDLYSGRQVQTSVCISFFSVNLLSRLEIHCQVFGKYF